MSMIRSVRYRSGNVICVARIGHIAKCCLNKQRVNGHSSGKIDDMVGARAFWVCQVQVPFKSYYQTKLIKYIK